MADDADGRGGLDDAHADEKTCTSMDSIYELITTDQHVGDVVLHSFIKHPDWLCRVPDQREWTPLHEIVYTGNTRLLDMLLTEGIPMDLGARGRRGDRNKTVVEVAQDVKDRYPEMTKKIEDLVAFEATHDLARDLKRGREDNYDGLIAALSKRLDWISTSHHKSWSVLHHVVHHGDVGLLQRIVGIPNAYAKIKVRAKTKDCKRSVLELARDRANSNDAMAAFVWEVLGPMFGAHPPHDDDVITGRSNQNNGGMRKEKKEEEEGGQKTVSFFPPTRAVCISRVKTLYFIRHAEGTHNEAARIHGEHAYKSWEYMDAELTDLGRQQCYDLRDRLVSSHLIHGLDLVVVSPLRRTLETATLALPPSQLPPHVPMVAIEAIREVAGLDPCNKRSAISAIKDQYPRVDFSQVQCDDDVLYDPEKWESAEDMADRGHYFLYWLSQRPERNIAVISHGTFLITFFDKVLQSPQMEWWQNTEMRGMAVHFPPPPPRASPSSSSSSVLDKDPSLALPDT